MINTTNEKKMRRKKKLKKKMSEVGFEPGPRRWEVFPIHNTRKWKTGSVYDFLALKINHDPDIGFKKPNPHFKRIYQATTYFKDEEF